MSRNKLAGLLAVAVIVGLGVLLCPATPNKERIDPRILLDKTLASEYRVKYRAKVKHTAIFNGKTTSFTSASTNMLDANSRETAAKLSYLIKRNYEPLVEGEDVIAERKAWTLRLKPKEKNHPWKQLWVDKKNYHVLASRDWSGRNNLKRSMKTLSITYQGALPDIQNPRYTISFKDNHPRYIPKGYILWSAGLFNGNTYLSYTDGLNTIGILIGSHLIVNDAKWKQLVNKGLQDSGQVLVLCKNSRSKQVIISADLPAKELEKIANSLVTSVAVK